MTVTRGPVTRGTVTRGTVNRGTVTRGTVSIDVEQCKGCELCIAACPPGVLVMSSELTRDGPLYTVLSRGKLAR